MYIGQVKEVLSKPLTERKDRRGKGKIRFTNINFGGARGLNTYAVGDDIHIIAQVNNTYPKNVSVRLSLSIHTESQEGLISCDSIQKKETYLLPAARVSIVSCKIFSPPLNYGKYHVNMAIFYKDDPEDWLSPIASFTIDSGEWGDIIPDKRFNPLLVKYSWKVE